MTKEEYVKLMAERFAEIQIQFAKMVKITQEFKKENPDTTLYAMPGLDRRLSDIAEGAAWFMDEINDTKKNRGSMTKKIRKALGYTIP